MSGVRKKQKGIVRNKTDQERGPETAPGPQGENMAKSDKEIIEGVINKYNQKIQDCTDTLDGHKRTVDDYEVKIGKVEKEMESVKLEILESKIMIKLCQEKLKSK